MSRAVYEISGLTQRYENRAVLYIDDLRIRRGDIVGLVGPNGSGKSTLLKILAFLEKPSDGILRFNGRRVRQEQGSLRRQVSLLLQDPFLLNRTVFENVAYGPRVRGETEGLKDRVHESLSWVGLVPEKFVSRQWFRLSGGEAQRVALASRLILKPQVLLLDEPTASVDAASVPLIQEAAIRAREEWGTTLVVSSHSHQWLYRVSDQVLHLFNGTVVGSGAENLIPGPWDPEGEFWKKILMDGQEIIVAAPPEPKSVALLDPSRVRIEMEPPTTRGENWLRGIVSQMSYENTTGDVMLNIAVSNAVFTSQISQQKVQQHSLYPGRSVWISFQPTSVNWIEPAGTPGAQPTREAEE